MMVQKLGFGESWINLVLECISTPTYLVLINGSPKGFFSSSRGLCQGDLISPYIFLLWVGLSSWLTRSLQAKRLSGAAASCGGPCLNHLFFADDCVIFGKVSSPTCDEILRVFGCYEKLSGLVFNRAKTQVFFSSNVQQSDSDLFTTLLVGQETKIFYCYLGFQLLLVALNVLHLKI